MIKSFGDRDTEALANGGFVRRLQGISRIALRKLDMIDAALVLDDLSRPSGNRLEALKGNRKGQHSVRINDQWRICFRWTDTGAEDVEIVDYH